MADTDALLDVRGAEKSFGSNRVLAGVDFAVRRGEFVSLLGPSGCGKTTLLRIVAGLMAADRGSVRLAGNDITSVPTHQRGVGVVFQNYALFPHLSVADNVAFGLKAQRLPKDKSDAIVARFLDLVHMRAMADRPVRGLSGGQQQRVAVARALAVAPKLMLLDEPFSALDRKLRETMQIELRHLLREVGITTVLVTHDQEEALVMSDRVAVMNHGAIEQFATPDEIYLRPSTAFALGFVGHSTRVIGRAAEASNGVMAIDTALGRLRARSGYVVGAPVLAAVRPERIRIGMGADAGDNTVSAMLKEIVFQGSKVHMHFSGAQDQALLVEASQLPGDLRVGSTTTLSWPVDDTLVFPHEEAK
ncbi:MAG: ABC transporter ATP-binding protein [Polaromonas sp.]|nr:ABC transporter ATP-binding protein [Polaromonas sp.]